MSRCPRLRSASPSRACCRSRESSGLSDLDTHRVALEDCFEAVRRREERRRAPEVDASDVRIDAGRTCRADSGHRERLQQRASYSRSLAFAHAATRHPPDLLDQVREVRELLREVLASTSMLQPCGGREYDIARAAILRERATEGDSWHRCRHRPCT